MLDPALLLGHLPRHRYLRRHKLRHTASLADASARSDAQPAHFTTALFGLWLDADDAYFVWLAAVLQQLQRLVPIYQADRVRHNFSLAIDALTLKLDLGRNSGHLSNHAIFG